MNTECYIIDISYKLQNFKKVSSNKYQFKCIYCVKQSSKPSGYYFLDSKKFHCYKCKTSKQLKEFVYDLDPSLLKNLSIHTNKYLELKEFTEKMKKPRFVKDIGLSSVSSLKYWHKHQLLTRKLDIPNKYHYMVFSSPDLSNLCELIPKHSGLVIPVLTNQLLITGYICFKKLEQIDINLTKEPLIFGEHLVDKNLKYYITNNFIDSLKYPNTLYSKDIYNTMDENCTILRN